MSFLIFSILKTLKMIQKTLIKFFLKTQCELTKRERFLSDMGIWKLII